MKYSSSCTMKLLCLLALLFVCPCADAKTLHVVHLYGHNRVMKNDVDLVRLAFQMVSGNLGGYELVHYPIHLEDHEEEPETLYSKLDRIASSAASEDVVWVWVSAHGCYVRTDTETENRTDYYFLSRFGYHNFNVHRLQSLLDDDNCSAHLKIFSHDSCYEKVESLENAELESSDEENTVSGELLFRGSHGRTFRLGSDPQELSIDHLAQNLRYLLASDGYYHVSAVRRSELAGFFEDGYGVFTHMLLKYLGEKQHVPMQPVPKKDRMNHFWDSFADYYNDHDRHLQYSDVGPLEIPAYIRYTNIYNGNPEIREYKGKGVVVVWVLEADPNCPASLMKLKKGDVIEAFRLGNNVYWVNNLQDTRKVIRQFGNYTTVTVRVLRKKWDPEYGNMAYFQEEIKDVPLGRQRTDLKFGGTLLGYNELFE